MGQGGESVLGRAGKGHGPTQADGGKDVDGNEHHLAQNDAIPEQHPLYEFLVIWSMEVLHQAV